MELRDGEVVVDFDVRVAVLLCFRILKKSVTCPQTTCHENHAPMLLTRTMGSAPTYIPSQTVPMMRTRSLTSNMTRSVPGSSISTIFFPLSSTLGSEGLL